MADKRASDRVCLTTWITAQGHEALKQRATAEDGGNLSKLVRRLLKYGMATMPKGYR